MISVDLNDREWSYLLRIADSHLKDLVTGRVELRDPQERFYVATLCDSITRAMQFSRTEVDEDCADDEYPTRQYATPWWDRPELANWQLSSGRNPGDGVTVRHLPCYEGTNQVSALRFAVQTAIEHKCPRDSAPQDLPADSAEVAGWIAVKNAEDACGYGPHPATVRRGPNG